MATILIVEDADILLEVLRTKLEHAGFNVAVARSGDEGLVKIKELHPDLVLLDIMLPGIDGFGVLEAMKSDDAVSAIPVIVISNSGQPVEIERLKELGVADWLVKTDFDPQEVLDKVAQVLDAAKK